MTGGKKKKKHQQSECCSEQERNFSLLVFVPNLCDCEMNQWRTVDRCHDHRGIVTGPRMLDVSLCTSRPLRASECVQTKNNFEPHLIFLTPSLPHFDSLSSSCSTFLTFSPSHPFRTLLSTLLNLQQR